MERTKRIRNKSISRRHRGTEERGLFFSPQCSTIRRFYVSSVVFFLLFSFFSPLAAVADPLRSFDEIFKGFGEDQKRDIFNAEGLIRTITKNEKLIFLPEPSSGIDIAGVITKTNPAFLAESLLIIPYQGKILDRLDVYNSLGRIGDLAGRLYNSHTRKAEIPLFEAATRIESERNSRAVPDPMPAREVPQSETVYMLLKDVNFGNSYYRGDMSSSPYGITYKLTNFRNLSYLFFPVIREEKFSAILYMEPLAEGMLVYSVAGADASDFIANLVDIPSAISKRLALFVGWISDGLKAAI